MYPTLYNVLKKSLKKSFHLFSLEIAASLNFLGKKSSPPFFSNKKSVDDSSGAGTP